MEDENHQGYQNEGKAAAVVGDEAAPLRPQKAICAATTFIDADVGGRLGGVLGDTLVAAGE